MTLDAAHGCVVDLDGVVWLAGEPLEGAAEGIAVLRRHGVPVLFATNNAAPTLDELRRAARRDRHRRDVATRSRRPHSPPPCSWVPAPGRSCVGAEGLLEALADAGVIVTDGDDADAVVVGLTTSFDYAACDRAAALVRGGARFVATNPIRPSRRPRGCGRAPERSSPQWRPRRVATRWSPASHRRRWPRSCERGSPPAQWSGIAPRRTVRLAGLLGVPFAHVASATAEPAGSADVRATNLLDAVLGLLEASP